MSEEKLNDENIIDRMLACTSIDEWNNARDFVKEFRNSAWISMNIDNGLIKQADLKKNLTTSRTNEVKEQVIKAVEPAIRLSGGSDTLRDWYRMQKHQN